MSSSNSVQHDAASSACAGTIVLLIDESDEMAAPVGGGTKSKAENAATAVNSVLNQLTSGPDVRVALVGYGGGCAGVAPVQNRWAGPLSGRVLVSSSELATAPVMVEDRVRRIPGVGGIGVAREETIRFPIWYVPERSGVGGFEEAAQLVAQMLVEEGDDGSGKPPLIVHIFGKHPTASQLHSVTSRSALEAAVWCHLHLGTSDRIPASLYPSSSQYLANEDTVALFSASSVLPEPLVAALRTANVLVASDAKGMVHQASMGDLIRFLSLAKAYASSTAEPYGPTEFVSVPIANPAPVLPATADDVVHPAAVAKTYRRVALLFLADRSQVDPESGAWQRRQEQVNEMIGRIARRAGGDTGVGLAVYGGDTVEIGFDGPLVDRMLVPDIDLDDGALRVEQVTEKVSNGIGGLVEVKRSRPVFVDRRPSQPAADLTAAVDGLAQLIERVRQEHENEDVLPLVMHVTGGSFPPEAIAEASTKIADLGTLLVYHAIVPEGPQPTAAYPGNAEQFVEPSTAAFWHMTSLLAGAEAIAAKRSTIAGNSRGFVVGARFDLLLESIEAILGKS